MTQEDVLKIAIEAGLAAETADGLHQIWYSDNLYHFAKLVAEHEREACAKECWKQMGMIPMQPWTVNPYEECAKAIRARGYQKGQTD